MRARMLVTALVIAAAAAGISVGSASADDRPPNDTERAAIEEVLRSSGFSRWGAIELDGGKWEVDDAVHSDGKEYDVDLSLDYRILKQDLD